MADTLARVLAGIPQQNFDAANKAMNLTPEEQALYQRHLSNLWGSGGVDNADGSTSTLFQMSTTGPDGRTYNLPTVYDGAILHPDAAYERAQQQGLQNFPSYGSDFAAENRYQQMHNFMERDKNPMRPYGNQLPVPGNFDLSQPQNSALAAALARGR